MAGRGTDIVLGGNPDEDMTAGEWEALHDRVVELGGLHIVGTERHEARRIDNQLRGRCGRQGDPGTTRFYVALDDDLMRRFGGDRIKSIMDWAGIDGDVPIENRMISKSLEGAQVKVEAYHFDARKHLVEYDDVVNMHRDIIYGERNKILSGADLKANIQSMVHQEIQDILDQYLADRAPEQWETEALLADLKTIMPPPPDLSDPDELAMMAVEEIEEPARRPRRRAVRPDRADPDLGGDADGRASADAQSAGRQLGAAPDDDGEPEAGRRPACLRTARPPGDVQERGPCHVPGPAGPHSA